MTDWIELVLLFVIQRSKSKEKREYRAISDSTCRSKKRK
jgi:hypothetical protein